MEVGEDHGRGGGLRHRRRHPPGGVASLLSGYGPRVQLSVFECQVRSQTELQSLRAQLRSLIDPMEDQVRIYPTTTQTFS